ncbi:hypothetical protein ACIGZJ_17095 [Kitasatospora sp. NPDC052868]|uniref:hypothetical protein n=1 Tax=Kitasatospora sp. NPDC052868 TaxID=3364060 RepID=UPI0037C6E4A5
MIPRYSANRSTDGRRQKKSSSAIQPILANLTGILTVTGLIVFVILSVLYEKFYSELGVSPADVGIGYTETLAHSYGFVVLLLLFSIFLVLMMRGLNKLAHGIGKLGARWRRKRYARSGSVGRGSRGKPRWTRRARLAYGRFFLRHAAAIVVTYVGLYAVLFANLFLNFNLQDDLLSVQYENASVSPYRWCSLTILDIRAQKVTAGPGTEPGIMASLEGKNLFYLGLANGVYVIYDAIGPSVWRISIQKFNPVIAPEATYSRCIWS